MAGVKAYDRATYLQDVRTLRERGWTHERIAAHLQISVRTVYRIAAGK